MTFEVRVRLFGFTLVLFALLFARQAMAQSAPVPVTYVVEVSGGGVDAARLRASVARELSVSAVAPDDAEASAAKGVISIEARAADKTLTVTFRKSVAPVARTVRLPDDPARAEVAAVFLVGNLARDESKELLAGLKKPSGSPAVDDGAAPAPSAPRDSAAEAKRDRDDEDLRRLRVTLQNSLADVKRRMRGFRVGALGFGAVAGSAGVFLLVSRRHEGSRNAGSVLLGVGAYGLGFGLFDLWSFTPDVELQKRVAAIELDGGTSAQILARIEAVWEEEAREARSARKTAGIFGLALGTLSLGIGTTLELAADRDSGAAALAPVLLGVGAGYIGAGLYALLTEAPFETSYQTWRNVRAAMATNADGRTSSAAPTPNRGAVSASRPWVSLAPLQGGGAISAGFSF